MTNVLGFPGFMFTIFECVAFLCVARWQETMMPTDSSVADLTGEIGCRHAGWGGVSS